MQSAPESSTSVSSRVENTYNPPPPNNGTVPFGVLVSLFAKLEMEKKQDKRRNYIEAWFKNWRQQKGYDLYPVLRLLLPQKDKERAVYGLKEKNLAKTIIKLIPLGRNDPDAIRLMNWKKPTEPHDKISGDFTTVLYEVVEKRSSVTEGSLSIDDVNEILDELRDNSGKQDAQSVVLRRVYGRATPEEQKWIARIILKDMVMSVKETIIFSVFHRDAQDMYNACSDLKKVAWELWNPTHQLNAKTVQIFQAFAPMLCKRPTTIKETVTEMLGAEFFIDEKMDGERMQLHKRGDDYFYCSRKGKDYTYLYGENTSKGSLTPYINGAFDKRITEIILDGEMLAWDPVSERNLPFGTLKTAALDKSSGRHKPRPCFIAFDLLYLNGQSLTEKSLTCRRNNLKHYVKEIKGRIEFVKEYRGTTGNDIRAKLEDVMNNRGEGLVVKHPKSKYILNERNLDWIKVKPEYMDNMGETVDVLVVAGLYGSGKFAGGVATLICAVLDDRKCNDEDEPKYRTLVKVSAGLTLADYAWIRSKPWKTWDNRHPPSFLQTAKKSHEDKGDVYLEPEYSFIIKLKAAEIIPSDHYHLGFTLRFPRVMGIRDDLSIADCMPASAVFEGVRMVKKRKLDGDTEVTTKKKTKVVAKKATILPEYRGSNLKSIPVISDLFSGMTFVVVSDPKSRTGDEDKRTWMSLVYKHGGQCAQIARMQENLLVLYNGSTMPYDIKLTVDKGKYDIVRPSWIEDSVARGKLVPLRKKYFFHATDARMTYEEYNDTEIYEVDSESHTAYDTVEPRIVIKDDQQNLHLWLRSDKSKSSLTEAEDNQEQDDSDSATENESDVDSADDFDWGDCFEVKNTEALLDNSAEVAIVKHLPTANTEMRMGESDAATEYDPEQIFKHLCFYLDTPENARENGMIVKSELEREIREKLKTIADLIVKNGGKLSGINDPKLTHVVLDKRDMSRRLELIVKRTSRPKRRHLVVAGFITACIAEETLLSEDDFAP